MKTATVNRASRNAKATHQPVKIIGHKLSPGLGISNHEFGQWLSLVPPIGDREITLGVNLTMDREDWFRLAEAAARNKTTVPEILAYYLSVHHEGLLGWENDGYEPNAFFEGIELTTEQRERAKEKHFNTCFLLAMAKRHASALFKLDKPFMDKTLAKMGRLKKKGKAL